MPVTLLPFTLADHRMLIPVIKGTPQLRISTTCLTDPMNHISIIESRKLNSIAQTYEPYELIFEKQFNRLLKTDTSSCCVLVLESTEPHIDPTSDDYRSCLNIHVVSDFPEVFPSEFLKTLPPRRSVGHHIDLHPESKPFA
jgi:hypothetical protein